MEPFEEIGGVLQREVEVLRPAEAVNDEVWGRSIGLDHSRVKFAGQNKCIHVMAKLGECLGYSTGTGSHAADFRRVTFGEEE